MNNVDLLINCLLWRAWATLVASIEKTRKSCQADICFLGWTHEESWGFECGAVSSIAYLISCQGAMLVPFFGQPWILEYSSCLALLRYQQDTWVEEAVWKCFPQPGTSDGTVAEGMGSSLTMPIVMQHNRYPQNQPKMIQNISAYYKHWAFISDCDVDRGLISWYVLGSVWAIWFCSVYLHFGSCGPA